MTQVVIGKHNVPMGIPGKEIVDRGVYVLNFSEQRQFIGHLYIFSNAVSAFVSITIPGEVRTPQQSDVYLPVKQMKVSDVILEETK